MHTHIHLAIQDGPKVLCCLLGGGFKLVIFTMDVAAIDNHVTLLQTEATICVFRRDVKVFSTMHIANSTTQKVICEKDKQI